MKGLIDLLALLIGVMIWQILKPQLGYGGLVIGGIVAFILRLAILRLFIIPERKQNLPENTETAQPTPPNADEKSIINSEITESKE